ncbi:MAG: hypothetical protein ACYTXT_30960 [Nostoc sp.]
MLAKSTEMRKQSSILRKQYAFLLAESTEMNARYTEMRKQLSILRKQYAFLLAESTEKRKQYAFLLIEIDSIGYSKLDKLNKIFHKERQGAVFRLRSTTRQEAEVKTLV